jgi:PAS domain-containing protein
LNKRTAEILAPSGNILGTQLWQSFPEAARTDLPYWNACHRTMDEGVTSEFETYYPQPLNIALRVRSYPSDDGITIFFRDISDEKRAHKELQRKTDEAERQHAAIEAVYRTAPIGLASFDLNDFRYLRLNDRQAAFFGLKPEQVVRRTLMEMAPIPGLRDLFEQVARGEPVTNYPLEGALINDPQDYRYWVVNYFPVYAPDGSVQAITASSLEITQQKKVEQALIETDKLAAVGRLASSIAHEINNPLAAVTTLLYLAKSCRRLFVPSSQRRA